MIDFQTVGTSALDRLDVKGEHALMLFCSCYDCEKCFQQWSGYILSILNKSYPNSEQKKIVFFRINVQQFSHNSYWYEVPFRRPVLCICNSLFVECGNYSITDLGEVAFLFCHSSASFCDAGQIRDKNTLERLSLSSHTEY